MYRTVSIYGDSVMKATVPDEEFHYRFTVGGYLQQLQQEFGVQIRNRALFGSGIARGLQRLETDAAQAAVGSAALIEFGGNDCNFRWAEIAAEPLREHQPLTPLADFCRMLREMIRRVREAQSRPVLMSLPPIHPERYLRFITRDGLDREAILQWLGDVGMIYRFHERYSQAVCRIAAEQGCELLPVREAFLTRHDFSSLLSADGIHPSAAGYDLIFSLMRDAMAGHALTCSA